jgi:hypothetical protein
MGAFRDLTLEDASDPNQDYYFGFNDEIDNPGTDPPNKFDSAYFRHINIGAYREFAFGAPNETYGQSYLYYYGDLTIDPNAIITLDGDEVTDPNVIANLIRPAIATIYGDWNGDCEITNTELARLQAVVQLSYPYAAIYDGDCDGDVDDDDLDHFIEAYLAQPPCGESLLGGGGGGDEVYGDPADPADVAAWLASYLSEGKLSDFIAKLTEAASAHEGTYVGDEMAALLAAFET